jgi:hypothetical protein
MPSSWVVVATTGVRAGVDLRAVIRTVFARRTDFEHGSSARAISGCNLFALNENDEVRAVTAREPPGSAVFRLRNSRLFRHVHELQHSDGLGRRRRRRAALSLTPRCSTKRSVTSNTTATSKPMMQSGAGGVMRDRGRSIRSAFDSSGPPEPAND